MLRRKVEVKLRTGLQARPAARFVQEANRYAAEIYLEKDEKVVNAKSIMGVMSLAVAQGTQITLSAEGHDAEEALQALSRFVTEEA